MVFKSHARSGPTGRRLCANWLTEWERHHDPVYRDKIVTGIEDIKKAPLQLVSGPDFEFDPIRCICAISGNRRPAEPIYRSVMGAPQVWMEMAEL